MDNQDKFQLPSARNVDAVDVDTFTKVEFNRNVKPIIEYDITNVLNVTEVFDDERQNTDNYRFFGEIEYISPLSNRPRNYNSIEDIFTIPETGTGNLKDVFSDFRFYLVKAVPPSGITLSDGVSTSDGFVNLGGTIYRKDYEVITELSDFDVFNAGFAANIFGERQQGFIVSRDIDLLNDIDGLNFPITDIYIYAEYRTSNGETIQRRTYNSNGEYSGLENFTRPTLSRGDVLVGDTIDYDQANFTYTNVSRMEFRIDTVTPNIKLLYNPFIPINIRTLSDDLEQVNTGSTSVEDVANIPFYAVPIDNDGNVVWRNLLPKGIIDPLTFEGNSFPFLNQRHYVFKNIIVAITPDLSDGTTASLFSQIEYNPNTVAFIQPVEDTDLEDIGKKC
jgi:hypothetical protein